MVFARFVVEILVDYSKAAIFYAQEERGRRSKAFNFDYYLIIFDARENINKCSAIQGILACK